MDSVMKSARHFNFQTAQLYMDDAEVQLNCAEAHDSNAKFKVPRFNMSIMFNEAGGRRTNEDTLEHFPTILAVAEQFVHKIGVMDHHGRKNQPLFVVDKAVDVT